MPDHFPSIAIGVAAGVLTAFFVSMLSELWTSSLLPLLKRWIYRGPDISGAWKGLGTGHAPASGEWSEIALDLKQHTHELRGTLVLRDRSAGHSIDLDLKVAGTTSQGYVTLGMWPRGRRPSCAATALLKIDEGGALNGQLLYLGAGDKMEVLNVSVHRAGSIAAPRLLPSTPPSAAAESGRCAAWLEG